MFTYMHICIYIYIFICVRICNMYRYMWVWMYGCIHACMYVYIQTHIHHKCTCIHTYTHTYTHYAYIQIYVHILYTHIYIHTHIHTHVYMYMCTHTHTQGHSDEIMREARCRLVCLSCQMVRFITGQNERRNYIKIQLLPKVLRVQATRSKQPRNIYTCPYNGIILSRRQVEVTLLFAAGRPKVYLSQPIEVELTVYSDLVPHGESHHGRQRDSGSDACWQMHNWPVRTAGDAVFIKRAPGRVCMYV